MDAKSHYREAATRGASGVGLVILLYEQMIQDLRQGLLAIKLGDVRTRTQAVNHVFTIVAHLQCTLDRERGGEVSRNLDRLYNCMRRRLTEAHLTASPEILNEQISSLLSLRDAWIEVDRATRAAPSLESPTASRNSRGSAYSSQQDAQATGQFIPANRTATDWTG